MAATCILAEYVKALRESVGLPLFEVMIRCDNRAAIVLASGEGTWKTKTLTNRVSWIREAVKWGDISVEYVSTHDQLADSFTKFLPGVAQGKATHNLSLEPLNYKINLFSLRVISDSVISAAVCRSKLAQQDSWKVDSDPGAMAEINQATVRKSRPYTDLSNVTVKAHELLELSFKSTATVYDDSFDSATINHEVYGKYLCGGNTSLFGPIKTLPGNYVWVPRTHEFLKNHEEFPASTGNFHGSAAVRYRVSEGNNDEFKKMVPETDLGRKPLIGLRVYPDVLSVLGIGLYQDVYKTHRTNICAYQTCKWGVCVLSRYERSSQLNSIRTWKCKGADRSCRRLCQLYW